jgi:hypothetical protein
LSSVEVKVVVLEGAIYGRVWLGERSAGQCRKGGQFESECERYLAKRVVIEFDIDEFGRVEQNREFEMMSEGFRAEDVDELIE